MLKLKEYSTVINKYNTQGGLRVSSHLFLLIKTSEYKKKRILLNLSMIFPLCFENYWKEELEKKYIIKNHGFILVGSNFWTTLYNIEGSWV